MLKSSANKCFDSPQRRIDETGVYSLAGPIFLFEIAFPRAFTVQSNTPYQKSQVHGTVDIPEPSALVL